jgi:hypothetical protein
MLSNHVDNLVLILSTLKIQILSGTLLNVDIAFLTRIYVSNQQLVANHRQC